MIKVVNLVSVIIAPIVVQYNRLGVIGWVIVSILLAVVVWSILKSKRPAQQMTAA
jgi:hypothetical protein